MVERNKTIDNMQGHRKLLWWGEGGWVKMLAIMVDWQQKIKKKNTGKNVLKQSHKKWNLDQNINYSKSHVCNSFLKNIILGIQL